MKRILILANNDVGLYKFRKELVQALIDEGNEIYVSLPYGELVDKLIEMGCKFIDTSINRRSTNPIEDIRLFNNYIKIIRDIKPDIVLTYTVKPNIYGGIACRLNKTPYICNVTGLGSGYLNGGIVQKIVRNLSKISFKKANKVFFQNTADMNLLVKQNVVNDNYGLLPGSGVNLNSYKVLSYPSKDDPISFNFVARVMKDKGIDEYLEAAKVIKKKYSHTIFNVIGMIEQPHYKEILEEYERKGIIKYHGFQNDTIPFMKQCSCTINPSYSEGMSNVLLESAASGRPIIASDIPGCKEIIDEGINGYTFKAKDASSLVFKIENFINISYEEKIKMGLAGRSNVERKFDRQIVVNTYMNEIELITTKGGLLKHGL